LERQFRNLFTKASSKSGITGDNLLQLLEARLDNTVYRLGIAPTRSGARQLVSHKHITVNGEVVNIPSYQLRAGDVIAVREKSKSLEAISNSVSGRLINKFNWLDWNASELSGKFLAYPNRDEIPENIKENLIVELYSK
jgi:small subunit ribosomal protein S4